MAAWWWGLSWINYIWAVYRCIASNSVRWVKCTMCFWWERKGSLTRSSAYSDNWHTVQNPWMNCIYKLINIDINPVQTGLTKQCKPIKYPVAKRSKAMTVAWLMGRWFNEFRNCWSLDFTDFNLCCCQRAEKNDETVYYFKDNYYPLCAYIMNITEWLWLKTLQSVCFISVCFISAYISVFISEQILTFSFHVVKKLHTIQTTMEKLKETRNAEEEEEKWGWEK